MKLQFSVLQVFVGLLVTLMTLNLQAASFYIGAIKSSHDDKTLIESVQSLMTTAVTNAGGTVSNDAASADFTLRADIVQLGPAYVLTVTRMKGTTALYSARQKAMSIQELDDAADLAVRAAMIGNNTKKDIRVGEVKERDKEQGQQESEGSSKGGRLC